MSDSAHNTRQDNVEATDDELRVAPRFTLLLRTAKLIGEAGEYLCVVRDVSASGISVRTFHPLPEGELTLELPNGERHPIERVWEKEGAAKFRFPGEVDVGRLIEGKGRFPKRSVRLHLDLAATLSSLGGVHAARIRNLSQQGARVECPQRFAIAQVRFPDPDDTLRLVQVRDLIAGQGWFDLHMHRVDAPHGGVPMHWSRLVDIPLAASILLLTPLVGQGNAFKVWRVRP